MGQFVKIESDQVGIEKITNLPKSDQDGVYNCHRIDYTIKT